MARLEEWSLQSRGDFYSAPETIKQFASGYIYDGEKERFDDGIYVDTSTLVSISLEDRRIETRNSIYELGEICPKYQKWLKDNVNIAKPSK